MKGKLKYFSVIWLGAMLMALLPAISAFAENGEPDDIAVGIADMSIPSESATAGEGLTASLITCAPGPEVYELFGHEAIRIKGIDRNGLPLDSVWNYGVFDFASPNFIYRFVKGETDYMLYGCPFSWFISSYVERGSGVTEQELNFTQEETERLRKLLQINALPAHRTYRYSYIRDNCSTRVAQVVEEAVKPRRVIWPDTVNYGSFRKAMRDMHRDYPWYQFGIDLALGSGIDRRISSQEELFAPLLMEEKAAGARFGDGAPLVKSTEMIYPGAHYMTTGEMGNTLPPTPWWLSPRFAAYLVLMISIAVAWMTWRGGLHGILLRGWYSLYFGVSGLAGCLLWFLVFVSSHDATSPNLLALWLNPLQLVIAVCVWWRGGRPAAIAMAAVNVLVLAVLSLWWPWQSQSANDAIFPLWLATAALCGGLCGARSRQ
ncbi:MAG: DUF4105 domain-containing protein [Muribaculaceae bacterium]|nr:DUF4105 domain-containing protein [Muribaculaceae bacterium]